MTDATSLFIKFCWIVWAAYWAVMAFTTKRTVERGGFVGYRLVALMVLAGCVAIGRWRGIRSTPA